MSHTLPVVTRNKITPITPLTRFKKADRFGLEESYLRPGSTLRVDRYVVIVDIKRLQNSTHGNPRFEIVSASGMTYRTAADGAVSYEADNYLPTFAYLNGQCRNIYCVADLHIDGRGNVEAITGPDAMESRELAEAGKFGYRPIGSNVG